MRVRKRPWTTAELETNNLIISDPEAHKGNWIKVFNNPLNNANTLHLEIGCGKGKFICELAEKHPEINFIAIERAPKIMAACSRQARTNELKNVLFIHIDAKKLNEVFDINEISRIYINFCDPWPKKHNRWAKRRLTHRNFLELYYTILSDEGEIYFKTDNAYLFQFTISEFKELEHAWTLGKTSANLHSETYADEFVKTEYEEKFIQEGCPIHLIEAFKKI